MSSCTRPLKHAAQIFLLLLVVASHVAMATETDMTFSGFASVVYAKTLTSDEGLLSGISDEGEYRDFNTLGMRMNVDFSRGVSFAAQMVAYGSDNYEPQFDWIYASIDLNPEFRLDVGKSRIPLYMYSDFIDVGYAYQWIEPPSTVYVAGRSFFQSVDGLKLSYVTHISDWESELLVFGGNTEEHFMSIEGVEEIDLYIDGVMGAAWTMEREWLTLRAVYTQGDITLEGYSSYDLLLSGIHGVGSAINFIQPYVDQPVSTINTGRIEDMAALKSDQLQFAAISVGLDFGEIFSIMEITQSLFEDNIASNDSVGGYLTFGVRLPYRVTFSVNYGERKQNPNRNIVEEYEFLVKDYKAVAPLTSSSVDPSVQAVLATVNELIDNDGISDFEDVLNNAVNVAQNKTIKEYSIQLRWDFHASAALKFEYLIQDNNQFSSTSYLPERVTPQAYRVGVDVVF